MLKKLNVGGYINALAAILGLVGTVLTIVSGVMSADNALAGLPMIVVAGILGAVLCLAAVYTSTRWGNYDLVGSVCILGAIALYCYVFGAAVSQRVMLIAGLYSFNAGNAIGWSVFYVSIAAWVCLLVGCVALMVSAFLRTVREKA